MISLVENVSRISIRMKIILVFILLDLIGFVTIAKSQTLAFPGAEGFGKYTTGGRGGIVLEVTNLNDKGTGSLRAAIEQSGTRTIVFRVSGTIYLKSVLAIKRGNVTIAGQTAPGDGITLAHYNFKVDANNVIIRYIRSRLSEAAGQQDDAFTCRENSDIIVDHCSFSWGVDEVASCYINKRFTMQYCMVSEGFNNSIHEKGPHGYGGIWGGDSASFLHNLIAHNASRNPRFNGARYVGNWNEEVDFRYNVIYNWQHNSSYGGEPSDIDGNKARINMVNNYYKAGPGTESSKSDRILEPYSNAYGYSYWYIDSNYVYGFPNVTADNWSEGVQNVSTDIKNQIKSDTAFAFDISTQQTAEEAYNDVLSNVGANIPYRDTVDSRIIWETRNDTALYGGLSGPNTGIIDNLQEAGGYPELFSARAPNDSDHDGIPDQWETDHGLNPNDSTDRNNDLNGLGYTALEDYLNSITPGYQVS